MATRNNRGETASPLDHQWNRLIDAVRRDWCDPPEPLDGQAVLRRLQELATQAARQAPSVRQQVIEDAPGVLLLAFASFRPDRPFSPWARRVLTNHAISLFRHQRRAHASSPFLATLDATALAPVADDLAEVLGEFGNLCNTVQFPRPVSGGPQLGAVFALECRLRLLDRLVSCAADFLDHHLPLPVRVRDQRIRAGWPTVSDLWKGLRWPTEPDLRHSTAIGRACRRLAPEVWVEGLERVWATWVTRARQVVSRHLEPGVSASLFYHLFPGRRAGA
jgi:hypothetical protein